MIIDPSKKVEAGFQPNPDNTTYEAQTNQKEKTLWWTLYILSWLTIIGGIILTVKWVSWGNTLKQQQVEINEAASAIDVNLTKRRDVLIKLFESTKGYMKFEKETMENVTKLRSMNFNGDINKANDSVKILDTVAKGLNINIENYPNLKSANVVSELMSSSQYIESEISSSRRLYNLKVTSYNQNIVTFPISVKAKKMNLISLPVFTASPEERKDVDLSGLSNV